MKLYIQLLLVSFFICDHAAASCFIPYGQEAIDKYPIIFKGERHQINDQQVKFKILKLYKGALENTNEVIIGKKTENAKLRADHGGKALNGMAFVVFLNEKNEEGESMLAGRCSPGFSIETINRHQRNYWAQVETLYELEMLNAKTFDEKLAALQLLNEELPDVYKYYYRKAHLLEENEKYEQALNAYKISMAKRYISYAKNNGIFDEKIYESEYKALFEEPLKITERRKMFFYTGVWHPMLGYGRTLYKMGKYEDSYKILKHANEIGQSKEIKEYLQKTSKKLNNEYE